MRLSGHLAIGLAQSAEAFADVVDTVHDPAFDEFLGRNARWQFSSKKIPAFGTSHLGVRNFHRERIDHCIAMLAHLIKHFLDVKRHVVGPHEIDSDPL